MTQAQLLDMFREFGAVQSCTLVLDKLTMKSKGFGFVEMPRAGEAKVAIKGLNAREVGGNRLRVKKAETREKGVAAKDSGTPRP